MGFERITELPSSLTNKDIEQAVQSFTNDSHCTDNKIGLANQTLETIAQAIIFKSPSCFFWLDYDKLGVISYAITHISKDVDNSLCYSMTQAWVRPDYRHTRYAKDCLQKLRNHAGQSLCKHIIVVSSRGLKGYLRFLGKKWHLYCHLLKEDI